MTNQHPNLTFLPSAHITKNIGLRHIYRPSQMHNFSAGTELENQYLTYSSSNGRLITPKKNVRLSPDIHNIHLSKTVFISIFLDRSILVHRTLKDRNLVETFPIALRLKEVHMIFGRPINTTIDFLYSREKDEVTILDVHANNSPLFSQNLRKLPDPHIIILADRIKEDILAWANEFKNLPYLFNKPGHPFSGILGKDIPSPGAEFDGKPYSWPATAGQQELSDKTLQKLRQFLTDAWHHFALNLYPELSSDTFIRIFAQEMLQSGPTGFSFRFATQNNFDIPHPVTSQFLSFIKNHSEGYPDIDKTLWSHPERQDFGETAEQCFLDSETYGKKTLSISNHHRLNLLSRFGKIIPNNPLDSHFSIPPYKISQSDPEYLITQIHPNPASTQAAIALHSLFLSGYLQNIEDADWNNPELDDDYDYEDDYGFGDYDLPRPNGRFRVDQDWAYSYIDENPITLYTYNYASNRCIRYASMFFADGSILVLAHDPNDPINPIFKKNNSLGNGYSFIPTILKCRDRYLQEAINFSIRTQDSDFQIYFDDIPTRSWTLNDEYDSYEYVNQHPEHETHIDILQTVSSQLTYELGLWADTILTIPLYRIPDGKTPIHGVYGENIPSPAPQFDGKPYSWPEFLPTT